MPPTAAEVRDDAQSRQRQRTAIKYLMASGVARAAGGGTALDAFERLHPRSLHLEEVRRSINLQVRAPVEGGTSETWAKPLSDPAVFLGDLATLIRQKQVIEQIPGTIKVLPNKRCPFPTGALQAGWVGLGGAIRVGQGTFSDLTMTPYQLALIVAATNELLTATGPQAEAIFEALLVNAAVTSANDALLNPAFAAVPELSPASITNGAFSVPSSGPTVAALQSDLGLITDNMAANGVTLTSPVLILSPASALRIGGLTVPAPGGGQSLALTIIQSPAAGSQVVLLDGSYFVWTDEGIGVSSSSEGTLEMSDAPTGDASVPTGATGPLVSMWQANATAYKVQQYLNWQLANPAAVGVVTDFGVAP
jgi:hypothetical protein